jgi:thiol-disulfide isomerase/thioredoxin
MRAAARRTLLVLAIAAFPFVAPAVRAGEGEAAAPAADDTQKVRDLWAARAKAIEEMRAAGGDREKAQAARKAVSDAAEAFAKAFGASDWEKYDAEKDTDILKNGLRMTGQKALDDDDPKTAVRALEALAARYPADAAASGELLARAYIGISDLAKARTALDATVSKGEGAAKFSAQVLLGDLLAAQGDLAAAQKTWQSVLDNVPAPQQDKRDVLARPRGDAETRMALIGKPAPEIDSKTWIDGDAKSLSAHKGQVVIVDFWATWCRPCREVMPGLDALWREKQKDGLAVLGVTHVYKNGFMPKAGTKDPAGDGERVKDLTPENYMDHLKQFKSNVGIGYPFVVTGDDGVESKAYRVIGIPTLAVIDRAGNVAFLQVGSGSETLVHLTVDRLLKAGNGPAPAK